MSMKTVRQTLLSFFTCSKIGVEIPSAEQVAVMKEDAAKAGKNADVKWFTKQWYTYKTTVCSSGYVCKCAFCVHEPNPIPFLS